jgi:hypothetical protein
MALHPQLDIGCLPPPQLDDGKDKGNANSTDKGNGTGTGASEDKDKDTGNTGNDKGKVTDNCNAKGVGKDETPPCGSPLAGRAAASGGRKRDKALVPPESSAGKQLMAKHRKQADGVRSAAYHKTLKVTGDREAAGRDGLNAKEWFLASKGVAWKGYVKGPRVQAKDAIKASSKAQSSKKIPVLAAAAHATRHGGKRAGACAGSAALAKKAKTSLAL